MAKSKTEAGRVKVKVEYYIGEDKVTPIRIGRSMYWTNESGSVRSKTWETKKIIEIGGKR